MTLIIVAVFVHGLAVYGWKIWRLTVELNGLNAEGRRRQPPGALS